MPSSDSFSSSPGSTDLPEFVLLPSLPLDFHRPLADLSPSLPSLPFLSPLSYSVLPIPTGHLPHLPIRVRHRFHFGRLSVLFRSLEEGRNCLSMMVHYLLSLFPSQTCQVGSKSNIIPYSCYTTPSVNYGLEQEEVAEGKMYASFRQVRLPSGRISLVI
jgi:hypothetical protein